jgi:hypothetical protein
VRDADVFGLPAVVAARGVRVAEDAADGRSLRVRLVAVAVELVPAEDALAAGDVEGHEDVVADLQLLHGRASLLDDARDLVAEGHPRPRVGHRAVEEYPGATPLGREDDQLTSTSIGLKL